MRFRHERLDNGLDVIAEVTDGAVSTSVGFFVKTGSRDETDALWGASHFLEHMVFKGTADLSGDEINRRFDWMGAAANAFTSEEDTVYHAAVLPEQQQEAVSLLARMMRPALRTEDFDTEKLVILEEIRMYDDQPPFGADDRCRAAFFAGHPLARSVLGTIDSITALDVDAMRDYHDRRYAPGNIVLAATGAVDFAGLVEAARRQCGDWEPRENPPRTGAPLPRPPDGRSSVATITRPSATLEYAVRMTAGPDGTEDDRFPAKLLAMILGDDSGSRLYWALVDSGAAEHASLHHHDFLDAGLFATQLSCDAADVEGLLARIADLYSGVARGGVAAAELEQARNKLAGRVVLAGERPRRRLFGVGLEWAHGDRYRSVADDLAIVEGIGLDDVHRVLDRWPLHGPAATVLAGPHPATSPGHFL
ncbi:MAG: insulinase family protein [Planctomycetia bacterium]|nr:insulinase family protein [Planctomycetia bacterium]